MGRAVDKQASVVDVPLRSIVVDRLRLQYADEGSGPCVLALHGMPGSLREFRWIAGPLGKRVRLVRLDLPGFGGSQGPREHLPQNLGAIAGLVQRFADRVIAAPFVVAGYSFGAPLATLIAAGAPGPSAPSPIAQVRGLAWIAPVGLRAHRSLRRAQHVRIVRWVSRLSRSGLIGRATLQLWRRVLHASGFPRGLPLGDVARKLDVQRTFAFWQHRGALRRVKVPVFAVWAEDDPFVEPEIVRELCRSAPAGPRLELDEGGHFLLRTRASEIAAGLAAFAELLSSPRHEEDPSP
jgi:pimeloyl-ACP methyl ester carboxylesterase